MPGFTTRPEIRGTFGVVATTHWLASAVAMGVLEKGGNAFDAAVAAGFTLQVVEPHLNGPLGEAPILVYSAKNRRCRDDLRPGRGAAGGDDRALPGARPRPHPRHRPARRRGAGRLRRLDAAVARLRHAAARRADRAGARLCRERLSAGRPHPRHDHDRRRAVPPRMDEFGGGLFARRQPADARAAVPQPRAGRDLSPRARRGGSRRRRPRARRSTAPATPGIAALSPRRSTASAAARRCSTPPAAVTTAF